MQNCVLELGRIIDLLQSQVMEINFQAGMLQSFELAITLMLHPR